jgi:hypothetical protein
MNYKQKENPPCNREDCFGNRDGSCMALRNTDFKKGVCPFYKSREEMYGKQDHI